jgi:hypothetical protein
MQHEMKKKILALLSYCMGAFFVSVYFNMAVIVFYSIDFVKDRAAPIAAVAVYTSGIMMVIFVLIAYRYKCRVCGLARYFTMIIGNKSTVKLRYRVIPWFDPDMPCQNCGATDESNGVPPENIFNPKK